MKNSFGNNIAITLFGESHGEMIGATLDGIPAGIPVDMGYIEKKLSHRKAYGKISTTRVEEDKPLIISGAYNGYTTGTPLTVLIKNSNTKSSDYESIKNTPRPSHADYTAIVKYGEYRDYRGGGHFSGRITAALVAVGAILESALLKKGVMIGTHIKRLGGVCDRGFENYSVDISVLGEKRFPVLSEKAACEMTELIESVANEKDSIGGILETAIIGVPAGIGEPWFDTLEGELAHAIFSVPSIKGVEFGLGFGFADLCGSKANDEYATDGEKIFTKTNNNGGINGGISNGMPILIRSVVKPTPSIFREQATVDLQKMQNAAITLQGRHDPAIIHRARPVIDAVCAIVIADMLVTKYGTDWLRS